MAEEASGESSRTGGKIEEVMDIIQSEINQPKYRQLIEQISNLLIKEK